jgi:hypothetical protein
MALTDERVPVRTKLSALWVATMFCYVYGDYFELYEPGKLREMMGGATQGTLLAMGAVMLPPCLMVLLSLVLPARWCRWMNVVLGVIYTVIMLLAVRGGWQFYVMYGVTEMALTVAIVWVAWTWPKTATTVERM